MITEFGQSLIYAHQGYRRRSFPFRWCIYQGNETVDDCIGKNTSPTALRELYPWVKELLEFRKELKAKENEIKDDFEGSTNLNSAL